MMLRRGRPKGPMKTNRERYVAVGTGRGVEITRRWIGGESMEVIGRDYGVTRARVQQIVVQHRRPIEASVSV